MTEEFVDNKQCFVCGQDNLSGLKLSLKVFKGQGLAETEVKFPGHFQGWAGVVHGGLVAAVLDEVMIYAASAAGYKCVTVEITARYLKPTPAGEIIRFSGKFISRKKKVVFAEAEALDEKGQVLAQASGKLFIV